MSTLCPDALPLPPAAPSAATFPKTDAAWQAVRNLLRDDPRLSHDQRRELLSRFDAAHALYVAATRAG